jgi:hypothetical protein
MKREQTIPDFERLLHVPGAVRDSVCGNEIRRRERDLGAGLDERREILHTVLKALPAGTDLRSVYEILDGAKQTQARSYMNGFVIDRRREFKKDQEELRATLQSANKIRDKWQPGTAQYMPLRDSMLDVRWPGDSRRPRAGHQPEPWLKEARESLARLKISRELREDLLSAVGLIPYRA